MFSFLSNIHYRNANGFKFPQCIASTRNVRGFYFLNVCLMRPKGDKQKKSVVVNTFWSTDIILQQVHNGFFPCETIFRFVRKLHVFITKKIEQERERERQRLKNNYIRMISWFSQSHIVSAQNWFNSVFSIFFVCSFFWAGNWIQNR